MLLLRALFYLFLLVKLVVAMPKTIKIGKIRRTYYRSSERASLDRCQLRGRVNNETGERVKEGCSQG